MNYAVSSQKSHKSGCRTASPQKSHGRYGAFGHTSARVTKEFYVPLFAFVQVKRLARA
jgi:hypothetical protein